MKNTNSLSAPINSSGEQVCVLDGCLVRVKYKDCPDKVSVMANIRGILLNSYRRDNIAAEDKDYASSNMLVWFVDEQVEEEESAREMITACEAVEGNKFGLYMLDKELAARTYTQAAPLASANA